MSRYSSSLISIIRNTSRCVKGNWRWRRSSVHSGHGSCAACQLPEQPPCVLSPTLSRKDSAGPAGLPCHHIASRLPSVNGCPVETPVSGELGAVLLPRGDRPSPAVPGSEGAIAGTVVLTHDSPRPRRTRFLSRNVSDEVRSSSAVPRPPTAAPGGSCLGSYGPYVARGLGEGVEYVAASSNGGQHVPLILAFSP